MNDMLSKLLAIAKMAVYDKKRAAQYLPMLDTQLGAVTAVMGVLAAMQMKTKIPHQVAGMLGVNIYLMMVDVAMAASGVKPDIAIMKATMSALMDKLAKGAGQQPAPVAQPEVAQPAQQPAGMIQQGAA